MKSPHEVFSPVFVAEVNHWESVDGAISILEMNLAKLAQNPSGLWCGNPPVAQRW